MRTSSAFDREIVSRMREITRLLLVRIRSLGDSILTLPLIEALHEWRPELRLGIVIEAPYAAVFRHHPAVKALFILKTKTGKTKTGHPALSRPRLIYELFRQRYPAVLNLHGGSTSMVITAATRSPLRLGQDTHRWSWIYNGRIPASSTIWGKRSLHTVEHQLTFMRWLGLPVTARSATLHIDPVARARIADYLQRSKISNYLVVHPTATLPTKQWTPTNFARLGDALLREFGHPIIYTAAQHEIPLLQQVQQAAQESHIYRADLTLAEHFALLERCRLFIGNDSGPMHAAAALKKPVVAVWGSSDFNAWHPWQTEYDVVRSDLACMPCPGYGCPVFGDPKCILDIPVSRVADACARLLSSTRTQISDSC